MAILFAVVAPAVGVVVAMTLAWSHGWMGWLYVNMVLVGWLLTGVGITVGYHRLVTHRSFETYPWVRACLMGLGALALQTGPLQWSAAHRKHHQFSDDHGDPHSPLSAEPGIWNALKRLAYSHVGWLFTGHLANPDRDRYVPDLQRDRVAVWVDRSFYPLWVPLSFLIPAVVGGLWTASWSGFGLGMLWGGLVRVFIFHHVTWSVNSICHLFGTTDFKTDDHSRNNFACALVSLGEGWHNNHHAFPSSARHGLQWWQIDASYTFIRAMELTGLAWDVHRPAPRAMSERRLAR